MVKYSKADKWILILLSVTFILTDWKVYNVVVSDIILMITMIILLLKGTLRMKEKQTLLYLGVLFLVFSNIGFNLLFNTEFIFIDGMKGLLKVFFYMTTMMLVYNYIIAHNLQLKLLKILGITAIVVCIIGVYISLAIYLKGLLPYEFFWKFTRTDIESYTYRGWGRSIIRVRSIFSEPAHLGYYLNAVLGILYFNKAKYEIDKKVDMIITITVILTFSFSSIIVMAVIKVLHYMNLRVLQEMFRNKKYILSIFVIILAIILMWGTIEKTIIIRLQEILTGSDGSATARLLGSWSHINNIFIGNGIGNSPILWNIFSYIISDLGFVAFLIFTSFTGLLLYKNFKMGILFIIQGFQKGGYLGAGYWVFMLLIIIYYWEKGRSKNVVEQLFIKGASCIIKK